MDMEQGRAGCLGAPTQHGLDVVEIVEAFRAVQIDNQMDARITRAVARHEGIAPVVNGGRSGSGRDRLLARPCRRALPGSQEGVLAHGVLLDPRPGSCSLASPR